MCGNKIQPEIVRAPGAETRPGAWIESVTGGTRGGAKQMITKPNWILFNI